MTFIAAENPFVLFALSQKDTSLDDPATLIMEVADWNEIGKEEMVAWNRNLTRKKHGRDSFCDLSHLIVEQGDHSGLLSSYPSPGPLLNPYP